jgi:hypothetical protein
MPFDATTLARVFLIATGVFFTFVFALPILFAPSRWARTFQWRDSDDLSPLTFYFARCLGASALAITAVTLAHAGSPTYQPILLELIAVAGTLLGGVHVYGALRRVQPWTEDAEILLYLVATSIAIALRVALPT